MSRLKRRQGIAPFPRQARTGTGKLTPQRELVGEASAAARAEFAMSVMGHAKRDPIASGAHVTTTAHIANVLGRKDEKIARVQAVSNGQDFWIVFALTRTAAKAWQVCLSSVTQGTIAFMLDGSLRYSAAGATQRKSAPLEAVIAKLSANKLQLHYHPRGVEQAFEMKRQIWRNDTEEISLPEVADRLRKYWPARRKES